MRVSSFSGPVQVWKTSPLASMNIVLGIPSHPVLFDDLSVIGETGGVGHLQVGQEVRRVLLGAQTGELSQVDPQ